MPEWLDKAIEYGLPLLAAIAGYVGAAKRFAKRLKDLRESHDRMRKQMEAERASTSELIKAAIRSAQDGDEALKAAFRDQLAVQAASMRELLRALESDLKELEERVGEGREQSAHDHSTAASLARDMIDVRDQCLKIHGSLNLVLGYLKAGGAKL